MTLVSDLYRRVTAAIPRLAALLWTRRGEGEDGAENNSAGNGEDDQLAAESRYQNLKISPAGGKREFAP